ncbi:uncharacterized protein BHQ10_001008 [Talaromyces amestolkiae]|uniref:Rhodopsin domain-containing protein n=1 Tax=Talaromyces amestolkiae TaxID=1196081 RepID=A0A364KN66_TALAM|nr:uncharacterized protein BHQ10_001008 [Talaromyces amestolkiae]RAO64996.1 hypothetical protein BHQ10_001008 [Talaromyces amestolkiae]
MASFNTDVDFNESRGVEINVIGWVFTGIAIATVGLKLFARGHMAKNLGWDDFFIFFSMGLSIIATAFVSYAVTLGLGRHSAAVVAEKGMDGYAAAAKWQIIAFPFNIGSFSFPNISIAILINNILDPNKFRTIALYVMAVLQVVFAMISAVLVFVQCKPTAILWDPRLLSEGSCWSADVFNDFTYWVSAYTTMTDIVLAIVPVTVFWKLQMRTSTKVAVCIMMSLTLLSAIVTIVKATYLHLFTDHTDPLYNVVTLVLWGLIEQNVVIVAACVPTLRPFFRKVFTNKSSRSGNSTGSHLHSSQAFKLSSKAVHSGFQRPESESEMPLDNRQGIWQTREVTVESEDDNS